METINNRIEIIDNIRGIAFIFMIIQHIFYFYDVSKYYETDYASNPLISMSGTIARTIFIILSGYSLALSNNNNNKNKKDKFKTPILVLTHAMLITCITWFLYPEFFIRFGVLHYIGLSTILLSYLAPYKNLYLPALIISYITSNIIPNFKEGNIFNLILGGKNTYNMMDYFPLLKWLPYSILGMYLFKTFNHDIKKIKEINLKKNIKSILSNIGKNSLNYYTLHIIILLLFYKFLSLKE
jgi:uncharacterized membrane protein